MTQQEPQTLARGVPGAVSLVDSARAKLDAALVELAEAEQCVRDNPRTASESVGDSLATTSGQVRRLVARLGNAAAQLRAGV